MSSWRVTFGRTVGLARNRLTTAFVIGGFLSVAAAMLVFNLSACEGQMLSLPAVWSLSVAMVLPALAAFLAMGTWSEEMQSGRIELMLTAAVREGEIVLGKFLGVWTMLVSAVGLFWVATVLALWYFSPLALSGLALTAFLPGLMALALQGLLWSAVSLAMSAVCRQAAAAAVTSLVLTMALPRGGWAWLRWWASERSDLGEFPLDAQVIDMASGLVSGEAVIVYLVLTALALFIATKAVAVFRLVGRGARSARNAAFFAVILAVVASVLSVRLVTSLELTVELPRGENERFSLRTRNLLMEADGEIVITAFLPRSDARFRPCGHFLRSLQREAAAMGGVRMELRFVDPRWDLGPAERLARRGVREASIVFERGRRQAVLPLKEGIDERRCAATIQSLTMPPKRRTVYWTTGHGENSPEDYGVLGLSDIARDLVRSGYRNASLDLATMAQIPGDCALIVVAGARMDFSRVELDRVDAYLREGGRLLVLIESAESGGVISLLPAWGLQAMAVPLSGASTLTGSEVLVSDFSDHAVVSPLKGSRVVLEHPVGFVSTAAAMKGIGADRIEFVPLARVGSTAVAAVVERGAGTGRDLSIRPTRIAVVGDGTIVMNGQLSSRANANRDFFLNAVAFLAGTDIPGASGVETNTLIVGLDRTGRLRLLMSLALALPLATGLFMMIVALRRRHRT